jgi:hypothetical protein
MCFLMTTQITTLEAVWGGEKSPKLINLLHLSDNIQEIQEKMNMLRYYANAVGKLRFWISHQDPRKPEFLRTGSKLQY